MQLTAEELESAVREILSKPTPTEQVRDVRTGSIGRVREDCGIKINERGEPYRRIAVTVLEPKGHHKKGDPQLWRNPVPCGL